MNGLKTSFPCSDYTLHFLIGLLFFLFFYSAGNFCHWVQTQISHRFRFFPFILCVKQVKEPVALTSDLFTKKQIQSLFFQLKNKTQFFLTNLQISVGNVVRAEWSDVVTFTFRRSKVKQEEEKTTWTKIFVFRNKSSKFRVWTRSSGSVCSFLPHLKEAELLTTDQSHATPSGVTFNCL